MKTVLDATPNCNVLVQLVVPHLDDRNQDVQGDVCKHLTCGKVKAENDAGCLS